MGVATISKDQSAKARAWVRGHLDSGVNPERIVAGLMKKGWPEYDARMVLDSVLSDHAPPMVAPVAKPQVAKPVVSYARPKMPAQKVKGDSGPHVQRMVIGAVMLIIGLAITFGTMSMASNGGTYLLCWGPIIFGFIRLVTGFIGWVGS